MFNQTDLKKIKEITQNFFKIMNFEVEIEISPFEDSTIQIKIKMEEPQILIGERGQTLAETQHLLKRILRKQIKKPFYVDLDINNYKAKKIEYLKELARSIADEVSLSKKEKHLAPMPAYERRIIHLELATRGDITTESIGEEPERKVIIKPYP